MPHDGSRLTRPPRVLAVCADDFGLTPAISRGIAQLAQRGRLTAVSCLTNGSHWAGSAALLAELPASVDRGMHFNLTEGEPLSAELRRRWPRLPSLPRLIAAAHLRRLPLHEIACEWQAQWQRFIDGTEAAPRFVDGHQHVHHLPGIRELILAHLATLRSPVAVRNTGRTAGPGAAIKRQLIESTGGRRLQQLLREARVEHNGALLGVYGFNDPDYRGRMVRWLAAAPATGGLLFCHPAAVADSTLDTGASGPGAPDAIAPARLREAAYLGSTNFADDLACAGISLGQAWQQTPSGIGSLL